MTSHYFYKTQVKYLLRIARIEPNQLQTLAYIPSQTLYIFFQRNTNTYPQTIIDY